MKIKSLKVCGIGPFTREVTAKFSELESIVSIGGPNGIGKTFLLECVPGALFGFWPFRMDGQKISVYDFVTPNSPAYVEMVFEIGGRLFRIVRNYTLDGTWTGDTFKAKHQDQTAYIYEWIGIGVDPVNAPDGWLPRAQQVRQVKEYVETNIVTEQLFLASVFNSQNSAGDLVSVPTSKRKEIFARLLGLDPLQEKAELFAGRVKYIDGMCGEELTALKVCEASIVDAPAVSEDIAANEHLLQGVESGIEQIAAARELIVGQVAQSEGIKQQIADKQRDIERLNIKKLELNNDRATRISTLTTEAGLRKQLEQLDGLKVEVVELEEKLKGKDAIRNAISAAQTIKAEIFTAFQNKKSALSKQREDIKDALADAQAQRQAAYNAINEYTRKAQMAGKLNGLDCPKNCVYVADAVAADNEISNIDYEKLKNDMDETDRSVMLLQDQLAEFSIEKINAQLTEYKTLTDEKNSELAALQAELANFTAIETRLSDLKRQIANIESRGISEKLAQMEGHRARVAELDKEIAALEHEHIGHVLILDDLMKQDAARMDHNKLLAANQQERDRLESERSVIIGNIAKLREQLKNSIMATFKKGNIEKRIERLRRLQMLYSRLSEAFGRNGMQALIIDSEKQQFLEIAKELFSILSGGKIALQFETTKKNKDGAVKEDFGIYLLIQGVRRDLKQCSQGQQDLGRIVMRATLGIYNSMKSGGAIETYFLDETTGSLDETNRESYYNFLVHLTKYFKQIIVITHQDIGKIIPCRIMINDKHELEVE